MLISILVIVMVCESIGYIFHFEIVCNCSYDLGVSQFVLSLAIGLFFFI